MLVLDEIPLTVPLAIEIQRLRMSADISAVALRCEVLNRLNPSRWDVLVVFGRPDGKKWVDIFQMDIRPYLILDEKAFITGQESIEAQKISEDSRIRKEIEFERKIMALARQQENQRALDLLARGFVNPPPPPEEVPEFKFKRFIDI